MYSSSIIWAQAGACRTSRQRQGREGRVSVSCEACGRPVQEAGPRAGGSHSLSGAATQPQALPTLHPGSMVTRRNVQQHESGAGSIRQVACRTQASSPRPRTATRHAWQGCRGQAGPEGACARLRAEIYLQINVGRVAPKRPVAPHNRSPSRNANQNKPQPGRQRAQARTAAHLLRLISRWQESRRPHSVYCHTIAPPAASRGADARCLV